MESTKYSDRASVWIITTAMVARRHQYVLLRLINPPPSIESELRLGTASNPSLPYGHVPTVSGTYKATFSIAIAEDIARQFISEYWKTLDFHLSSSLVNGRIAHDKIIQTPEEWGGRRDGKFVPTVMLRLDLGNFRNIKDLPPVTVSGMPDRIKDTVFWANVKNFIDTGDASGPLEGFYLQYRMYGERKLLCQRFPRGPLVETTVRHLGIQRTIVYAIERMLGTKVPTPVVKYNLPPPKLVFAA